MSFFFLILTMVIGFSVLTPHSGIGGKIAPIVRDHEFSLARWEFGMALEQVSSIFQAEKPADVGAVIEYFTNAAQVRSLEFTRGDAQAGAEADAPTERSQLDSLRARQKAMAGIVQDTIEQQVRETLRAEGIFNPFVGWGLSFPPVKFELARPPDVLVISPRDRIESIDQTMLRPDLPVSQAESIEARVDELNVSSLVTGIGGMASYPTLVADDMDLRWTIDTAAHEWTHQYLAFTPLGVRYALDEAGIPQSRDIISMNETLADLIGTEIGRVVYDRYYAPVLERGGREQPSDSGRGTHAARSDNSTPAFDFNAEMRAIRKQVDSLLAQGKVDDAEQYMNEKRDYLEANGYYIRKLNQAYFAFYGSYADSPTSIDPIGVQMKQLRSESSSLSRFLARASSLTSAAALKAAALR